LREEHTRTEEIADRLNATVARAPVSADASWLVELRERFEHLRAHLIRHMALEERDGYMAAAVERRPTLSQKIEALRLEHGQIQRIMDDIYKSVSAIRPEDRLLIRDVCMRVEALLSHVNEHHAAENLMMLRVFTDDIGDQD
jgi:iron-sulfur cluster repair protein YtfE (RIC family)